MKMEAVRKRINIAGSKYDVLRETQVKARLIEAATAGVSGYVCISNVHTTMMGAFDPSYRRITNASLLAVPDGMPLVWAMRSISESSVGRVRGPSLMRDLINEGRSIRLKHFLFGGSLRSLKLLQEVLSREYPGCEIVGAFSPPFKPLDAITSEEWEQSAKMINESGAHLVWVGLGAPKQERWMWEQRNRVNCIMLGVGAAFDLISGTIPEAPARIQNLGLEWAYRLWREPKRLWRRYIFNNPAFLIVWSAQWALRKLGKNFTHTN